MIVFPAIDLKQGQCVRLEKGDMNKATLFNKDPLSQVESFLTSGFDHLHLIDLDGAVHENAHNQKIIKAILGTGKLKTQIGGGVRSLAQVEALFDAGAWRVILGTLALTQPEEAQKICRAFPNKIVIALDGIFHQGSFKVALQGWKKISEEPLLVAAKRVKNWQAAAILFTDIARDGIKQGINIEETLNLAQTADLSVIASGGLKDADDIKKLTGQKNIEGVIAGRALYEGLIDVPQTLRWVKENA